MSRDACDECGVPRMMADLRHVMVAVQINGMEYAIVKGRTALTMKVEIDIPFPIEEHGAVIEELLANRTAMVLSWKKGESK